MALCYNFSRVLTIIGLDAFTAYLATVQRLLLGCLIALTAQRHRATSFAHFAPPISAENGLSYCRHRLAT